MKNILKIMFVFFVEGVFWSEALLSNYAPAPYQGGYPQVQRSPIYSVKGQKKILNKYGDDNILHFHQLIKSIKKDISRYGGTQSAINAMNLVLSVITNAKSRAAKTFKLIQNPTGGPPIIQQTPDLKIGILILTQSTAQALYARSGYSPNIKIFHKIVRDEILEKAQMLRRLYNNARASGNIQNFVLRIQMFPTFEEIINNLDPYGMSGTSGGMAFQAGYNSFMPQQGRYPSYPGAGPMSMNPSMMPSSYSAYNPQISMNPFPSTPMMGQQMGGGFNQMPFSGSNPMMSPMMSSPMMGGVMAGGNSQIQFFAQSRGLINPADPMGSNAVLNELSMAQGDLQTTWSTLNSLKLFAGRTGWEQAHLISQLSTVSPMVLNNLCMTTPVLCVLNVPEENFQSFVQKLSFQARMNQQRPM